LADVPHVERHEVEPLTQAQIGRFFRVLHGERLEALYVLALTTGLRRGELLGLRWDDVDLDAGRARVTRSLQRVSGRTMFVEPKSARSRRTLTLPAFVTTALKEHRRRQVRERLAAGEAWQDSGLVFTTADGGPLDGMNLTHHFQRLLRRAGLPQRRFHDLRHSCATVLLGQHVPARVVMEILGHSQISVTMNTYSHVLPAMQEEAAGLMEAWWQDTNADDAAGGR
jgi:integrase